MPEDDSIPGGEEPPWLKPVRKVLKTGAQWLGRKMADGADRALESPSTGDEAEYEVESVPTDEGPDEGPTQGDSSDSSPAPEGAGTPPDDSAPDITEEAPGGPSAPSTPTSARENPESVGAPEEDLPPVGSHVRVKVRGNLFWVRVTSHEQRSGGGTVVGTSLSSVSDLSLSEGDEVEVADSQIQSVQEGQSGRSRSGSGPQPKRWQ